MTTFTLKVIALIFMLTDHIGAFIPDMPIYLRFIGRLSAPIFFFCCAIGFSHTKSKTKYLMNLYIAGLLMALVQYFLNIDNNIFRTLFSMCIIIYLIDINKDKEFKTYLCMYLTWQIMSISIIMFLMNQWWFSLDNIALYLLPAFLGNIFYLEGGLSFVVLGIIFYYTRNNKKNMLIGFMSFVLLYFLSYGSSIINIILSQMYLGGGILEFLSNFMQFILEFIIGIQPMNVGIGFNPIVNYFWMMIFSVPFLLLYNGKRGRSFKYLFYIFYPLHIIILFFIGRYIS